MFSGVTVILITFQTCQRSNSKNIIQWEAANRGLNMLLNDYLHLAALLRVQDFDFVALRISFYSFSRNKRP